MSERLELTAQAEESHFWYHGFRGFLTPVLDRVAAGRQGLTIIDCGAGTGHNLTLLGAYGRVFPFDLDPSALTKARVAGAPMVRANVTHIPFRSNSFDIATSFDMLMMVPDVEGAVREVARVLKPGGAIVFTLPALEVLRGDHAEIWHELVRYTPASARALLTQAGLEVERVSFLFASLFPLMLVTRTLERWTRRFRRAPSADGDIGMPSPLVNAVLTAVVVGEAWLARHVPMPVGSSLLMVARKPVGGDHVIPASASAVR